MASVIGGKEWWKVTIVYKSGAMLSFVTTKFEISRSGGSTTYEWGETKHDQGPVLLGADEVAAVWQERA